MLLSEQVAEGKTEAISSVRKPTTIRDLPFELFLIIYENFDLAELNALSKLHPFHQRVAQVVSIKKFDKKKFLINKNGLTVTDNNGNSENINKIRAAYSALEIFGHSIKNLVIDYGNFTDFESIMINERLTKCLANSLVQIELLNFTNEKLKELMGPFNKVEYVLIPQNSVQSEEFNLLQIFPTIRGLLVNNFEYFSPAVVEHHFPHLEHILEYCGGNFSGKIQRICELNPQLWRLRMDQQNFNDLKLISELLPNLRQLQIARIVDSSQFEGDDLHFPNLVSFETWKRFKANVQRIPIVFGNLVEIRCHGREDKWFDVIMQNKKLKKITSSEFSIGQVQQIIEQLPNLEEFWTRYNANTYDAISQLIEASEQLKKVVFRKPASINRNEISERLQNKWEIVYEKDHIIYTRNS